MILVPLFFLERTEVLLWCCSSSIAHITPQTLVIFLVQPLILVSFQIQHLDLKNIWCFSKRILFLIWLPAFLPLFVLILALSLGVCLLWFSPFFLQIYYLLSFAPAPGGWPLQIVSFFILWLLVGFSWWAAAAMWKEEKKTVGGIYPSCSFSDLMYFQ